MRRQEVIETIKANWGPIKAMDVKSMAIFGSVARDQAASNSDVDILVEFNGPTDFGTYMDVKFFLEDLLGVNVDLATAKALRPRIRGAILEQAVKIA
jgi:uncharacterized protein